MDCFLAREQLAERLKDYRAREGLTQEQMAEKLGVSRMAYGYYENAKRTPDIEFIRRLHDITGYSTDFLLGLSDVKFSNIDKYPPQLKKSLLSFESSALFFLKTVKVHDGLIDELFDGVTMAVGEAFYRCDYALSHIDGFSDIGEDGKKHADAGLIRYFVGTGRIQYMKK